MLTRRTGILSSLAALAPGPARGEPASVWSKDMHSRARLLIAGAQPGAVARQAGIEITLDPGFKTYWRNPGDAGVPPVFNFAKSRNIKSVKVSYPAPAAFSDGGPGLSYGYKERVIFPLHIELESPGPAHLACALDYAVCDKICIPAKAALSLAMPAGGKADFDDELAAARARVPLAAAPGASVRGLSIKAIAWADRLEKSIKVQAACPASPAPALFADAPALWAFETRDFMPHAGGGVFTVAIVDRPKGIAPLPPVFSLTLVSGETAIEVQTSLEAVKPRL